MKRVSVIIPTYNRAEQLVEAIESVLAQKYQDFEIIVSDDGSIDDTIKALERFGAKVRYLYNDHSGLPARVRNAGINIATGEYIAFLDSDDKWITDKLSKQIEILENHPGVGLVCSNAYVINSIGDIQGSLYLEEGKGKSGFVFPDLIKNNFIITSTAIIRTEVLRQVGNFSELNELRVTEDYDLWLRIAANWEVKYLEEPLCIYRDAIATSIRGQQDIIKYWQGMIRMVDGLISIQLDKTYKKEINIQKAVYQKTLILQYWRDGKYLHAIRAFGNIFFHRPGIPFYWMLSKLFKIKN